MTVATMPRPMVDPGLDDLALGAAFVARRKLEDLGLEEDGVEELVDALLLQSGDLAEDGRAAPFLGWRPCSESWRLTVQVGLGEVDLVDRDDDRHLGRLGVVDGLDGLGHDAVDRGDHQDDDIGDCAPRARIIVNASWPGVSRNTMSALAAARPVGADVLGDAAVFACGHVGGADGVEELGLAVVDMAHDRDDGRTGRGPRSSSACLPR